MIKYYVRKTRKLVETKTQSQKSQQRNKHMGSCICKILGTILKLEKG